jgi:hypothetical protein
VNPQIWRKAAGVGVLVLLMAVAIALVPHYFHNMKFQSYLDDLVDRPQTPELITVAVLNKAAQLGLPVRAGDVHVTREGNGVKVEIVYVVRVDFPLYTVDLHFHPSAAT